MAIELVKFKEKIELQIDKRIDWLVIDGGNISEIELVKEKCLTNGCEAEQLQYLSIYACCDKCYQAFNTFPRQVQ